jgi:macrocin-O-methyltransferase TylF-like protien
MKVSSTGDRITAADLYLDLLKRVLTNTLFASEPNVDGRKSAFVIKFLEHYIAGPAISMLPLARMDNIQACVSDVVARGVPGDLIETGVWRGGATIFMRAILEALDATDRSVWVADSFEGLPTPDAERFPIEAAAHRGAVMQEKFERFAVPIEEVRANFETFGLLDERVRFLKGWFKDTLPTAPIQQIAVMRLDGDYYESTMDALVHLYDKLSVGGYVIVDDYGEDTWTYCRQAVDEFRTLHGIDDPLVMVDRRCFYWKRLQ